MDIKSLLRNAAYGPTFGTLSWNQIDNLRKRDRCKAGTNLEWFLRRRALRRLGRGSGIAFAAASVVVCLALGLGAAALIGCTIGSLLGGLLTGSILAEVARTVAGVPKVPDWQNYFDLVRPDARENTPETHARDSENFEQAIAGLQRETPRLFLALCGRSPASDKVATVREALELSQEAEASLGHARELLGTGATSTAGLLDETRSLITSTLALVDRFDAGTLERTESPISANAIRVSRELGALAEACAAKAQAAAKVAADEPGSP